VKPQRTLDQIVTPDGYELVLYERGGVFTIRVNGYELMSSRAHGSEDALATLACASLGRGAAPRVLIGGLGMGFTLRAALDRLPVDAEIVVAEVFPTVVEWNRLHLGGLAGSPLDDLRVEVLTEDVAAVIGRAGSHPFDAILLDVDNGPEALTLDHNQTLYGHQGIVRLRSALTPGGTLAVWSASPDRAFAGRLGRAGFSVRAETVRAHAGKGLRHVVYLATRRRA
jgi:spermidine synthase